MQLHGWRSCARQRIPRHILSAMGEGVMKEAADMAVCVLMKLWKSSQRLCNGASSLVIHVSSTVAVTGLGNLCLTINGIYATSYTGSPLKIGCQKYMVSTDEEILLITVQVLMGFY